jgi:hypothetical protein
VKSSFPSWFATAFRTLPKSESTFRAKLAQGMRKTSSWASEIEVRLLQMKLGKLALVVLNTVPKKIKFKKRAIYVLNIGEAHYNAILVTAKKIEKTAKECKEDKVYNETTKRCVSRTSCKGYETLVRNYEKMLNI